MGLDPGHRAVGHRRSPGELHFIAPSTVTPITGRIPTTGARRCSYISGSNSIKAGYQGSFLDLRYPDDYQRFAARLSIPEPHPQPVHLTRLPMWTVGDRTENVIGRISKTPGTRRAADACRARLRYDRAWSFSPACGQRHDGSSRGSTRRPITFPPHRRGQCVQRSHAALSAPPTTLFRHRQDGDSSSTSDTIWHRATNDSRYTLNNPGSNRQDRSRTVARTWADDKRQTSWSTATILKPPRRKAGQAGTTAARSRATSLNFGKNGATTSPRSTRAMLSGWGRAAE